MTLTFQVCNVWGHLNIHRLGSKSTTTLIVTLTFFIVYEGHYVLPLS